MDAEHPCTPAVCAKEQGPGYSGPGPGVRAAHAVSNAQERVHILRRQEGSDYCETLSPSLSLSCIQLYVQVFT